MKSLLKDCEIVKVMDSQAAGVTDPESTVVDMQGFDGVCFICKLGTVVDDAAVTMAVYQGDESDLSDEAELTGASAGIAAADTDSEQSLVVDVVKPRKRYVQAKVTRATQNSEIDSIFAILYNPRKKPVSQPATIDASTQVVSPAEA